MSKILVIEDESSIRRVLVKILGEENADYKVFEAEDGAAGLAKVQKEDFDLKSRLKIVFSSNILRQKRLKPGQYFVVL